VKDALQNCAVRYANSDADAAALAHHLRTTADDLRALPRGSFALYVRDVGAYTTQIPHYPLEKMKQTSQADLAAHRTRMISEYCYTREKSEQVTPSAIEPHSATIDEEKPDIDIDNISTSRRKDW
jgi:hypothetical protein